MKPETRKWIHLILDRVVFSIGFASIFIFLLRVGFFLSPEWNSWIVSTIQIVVLLFCAQELIRWITAKSIIDHLKLRWFENFIVILLAFYFIKDEMIHASIRKIHPNLGIDDITIAYLGITQSALVLGEMIRFFRGTNLFSNLSLSTAQIFSVSFSIPIFIGTCLLKLPKATAGDISWLDAFFTATSAVCVTGLSTLNTAIDFTPLGQFIICFLFQIGGLGIMTLSLSFGILFSGSLGLKERHMMSDIFSDDRIGEISSTLAKITAFTFSVEAIGAVFLYLSGGFKFEAINIKELYAAIFHSISAFCNAGFSLYTDGLATTGIGSNMVYGSTIMVLIVLGGLGFPVMLNLYEFTNPKRFATSFLSISTKLVLISTAFLLLAGGLGIFLTDGITGFEGMTLLEKIYHSAFISITSRTAGFNIFPTESLSVMSCMIVIILMWIGGSPMSTAGGIKNLTLAIAILSIKATIQGKSHIEIFGREIYNHSVVKAFTIIFVSIFILFNATLLLIALEPLASPLDLFFEAVSAFSTVGLTRGITTHLSEPSKIILIILMYTGRVGFITFISGFFLKIKKHKYKLLKQNIPIN